MPNYLIEKAPTYKPHTGFSLIELLIILTLITIIATFTIPAYKNLITTTSNQTLRAQLQHAIHLAQSEAMTRGVTITLCGTADSANCDDNWQHGIMLFIDETEAGVPVNKTDVLYIFNHDVKSGNLFWHSAYNVNYLQLDPSGMTNGENGKFWYCSRAAKHADWALLIGEAGRMRELTDPDELKNLPCV
jgi:type IV fimbrial biogenesis protein FimT